MNTPSNKLEAVTAYVNAGGRGTRLTKLFDADAQYGIAKALLEVGEPPVKLVDHHITRLSKTAFRNIVIGAGDQQLVIDHIAGTGKSLQVHAVGSVAYGKQLGTGGDLIVAIREHPELFGDAVLINNVDTILDIDDEAFYAFHKSTSRALSIALTRRTDVPNQNAYFIAEDSAVIYSNESPVNPVGLQEAQSLAYETASSTGAMLIDTEFLRSSDWDTSQGQLSLYRDIVGRALSLNQMTGYDNGFKFFADIGTVQSWRDYAHSVTIQPFLQYKPTDDQEVQYD